MKNYDNSITCSKSVKDADINGFLSTFPKDRRLDIKVNNTRILINVPFNKNNFSSLSFCKRLASYLRQRGYTPRLRLGRESLFYLSRDSFNGKKRKSEV